MPYGCAIKDYASGLCQPPSAHYKPYARSTAVSPSARKVSLGICGLLAVFCLATRVPCPGPHLLPSVSAGETGLGCGGGGEQRARRTGRFGSPGWNGQGTGSEWHKMAP